MPTYSGSTVTVDSGSQNIDISISQGNAILVSLEAASFAGTVDFKSTIDGVTYTNRPYVEYHAASPSKSVAQITNPTTYAAYVIFPPVIQARIVVAYSSGSLEIVWREIGYKAGLDTGLGALSSAELKTAISDETGSGAAVFATSPTLVTPALGTPASGVMTNATGTAANFTAGTVTTNADLTGDVTSDGNATTIAGLAYSKLAALSDGNILVGSGSNVATSVNPSGDVDVTNAGVFSIASDVIVDDDVKSDAAIAVAKTALVAGTNISLSTNTLNVDDAFLTNTGNDTTDGTITAAGFTTDGSVTIDSTPTDETVSGITATFTAGEALSRGEVVYYKQADSRMWKAVATAAATSRCVAMAAADIGSGSAGLFLLQGFCTDNGTFPDYSASSGVGKAVYTPEAETSGENVPEATAPDTDGDFVQIIGYVVAANTLYFNPSNDIIEHA